MNIKPEDVKVNPWTRKKRGSWDMNMVKGVQLIHLPTGTVIQTEEKRSQHANKALALKILEDKLKALA